MHWRASTTLFNSSKNNYTNMMTNNNDKEMQRQYRTMALLGISKWLFLGLIALIGILVAVFSPEEDPLDRSAIKNRRLLKEIYV